MQNIIHFETLGCRLNQDETEGACAVFLSEKFEVDIETVTSKTPVNENVLLCIINTCTVTSKAEQKARRLIRLCIEKFPESCVLVTGCYAQEDSVKEITSINPSKIYVLLGQKKFLLKNFAAKLKSFLSEKKSVLTPQIIENFFSPSLLNNADKFVLFTPTFQKHSRASIKVQDGCNCSCSFCKIHIARGKSISLDAEEVLRRVNLIESEGVNEIVFTGVNLSQYSSYLNEKKIDFADLLQFVIDNTKSIRFRISSFYPQYINEKFCKVISNERVQPFFHLSIQSGSNSILKQMHRPYKNEDVLNAINLIRKYKKDPFISCDIIAGFPGETEEDFDSTIDLCKTVVFSWIHAFPFSPRKGTEAFSLKSQVAESIKNERVKQLTSVAVRGKISYINKFIGKELFAIVENSRSLRQNKTSSNIFHAVTENFLHVEFHSEKTFVSGQSVKVIITDCIPENIENGKETECYASVAC